jgi:hypothetical protein
MKAELAKFEFADSKAPIMSRDRCLEFYRMQEVKMVQEVMKDLN